MYIYHMRVHQSSNYVCETSAKATSQTNESMEQEQQQQAVCSKAQLKSCELEFRMYTVNGMLNAARQSSIICLFDWYSWIRFFLLCFLSFTDLLRFSRVDWLFVAFSFSTLQLANVFIY